MSMIWILSGQTNTPAENNASILWKNIGTYISILDPHILFVVMYVNFCEILKDL